jgi:hypothetical protein
MARKTTSAEPLQKESISKSAWDNTPDRFKLGEMGNLGVRIFNGVSQEEIRRELNYPYALKTFKQMSHHSTIAAALNLYEVLISQAEYKVVEPENASAEEKSQTQFIRECLNDMEGTFEDFVKDALSAQIYGFSITEKVFRRRLKSTGSNYNDGKISIRKLAHRSQDTIEKFTFDSTGNDITGVKQNLALIQNNYGRLDGQMVQVILPRNKFLHVRLGRHRGDPYGKSPMSQVYFAYKYLTTVEELEGTALSKDLVGIPVLKMPASYLASDADPGKKATADNFKNILRNLQQGAQSGILLPSDASEETKLPLFSFELAAANGKKLVDTSQLKAYYTNQIMTTLLADILVMGQGSTGSYALGSLKNNMVGAMCKYLLEAILHEVNRDLIRQLYELNGFDTTRMCKIDSDSVEETPIEELSKAFQRAASTGLIELDRAVLNRVRDMLGIDTLPADQEVQEDKLTGNTSKASAGMATQGEGTSNSPSGTDTSSNNIDNAA